MSQAEKPYPTKPFYLTDKGIIVLTIASAVGLFCIAASQTDLFTRFVWDKSYLVVDLIMAGNVFFLVKAWVRYLRQK